MAWGWLASAVERAKAQAVSEKGLLVRTSILKGLAVAALFVGSTAGAASVEKALFELPAAKATCTCKGPNDCTCPKDKCKCKGCGKKVVIDALKGASETTGLPDTARNDARGGVLL
jgi:hypothetical protein